jgi:hypothetical protein
MEIDKNSIVPIKYKGKIIGEWQYGCIKFNDTIEAHEIMQMYLKGSINGVSSRKTGSVDESGKITEDKIIEFSLIDAPPITSFEDVQAQEQELVNRINDTISKDIILKCFELGNKQTDWNILDGNQRIIKYKIPIGNPNKKWWQFWKKSGFTRAEAEEIMKAMSKHKDYFIPTKEDEK